MNFGQWLRRKLYQLDRSQEWLYRRTGLTTGSCNRWTNGQVPSLEAFLGVCKVLANEEQRKMIDVIREYLEERC